MIRDESEEILVHPLRALLAARQGDGRTAQEEIRRTVAHRREFGHYHHAQYEIGCALALLGERESAVDWVVEAASFGYPCGSFFARDPLLEPLREMPRFQQLLGELEDQTRGFAALLD